MELDLDIQPMIPWDIQSKRGGDHSKDFTQQQTERFCGAELCRALSNSIEISASHCMVYTLFSNKLRWETSAQKGNPLRILLQQLCDVISQAVLILKLSIG